MIEKIVRRTVAFVLAGVYSLALAIWLLVLFLWVLRKYISLNVVQLFGSGLALWGLLFYSLNEIARDIADELLERLLRQRATGPVLTGGSNIGATVADLSIAGGDSGDQSERTDPLVIDNLDDLNKLTLPSFLERNLLAPEFSGRETIAQVGAWNAYNRALHFTSQHNPMIKQMVSVRDSWAIVGEPGVGKSALMLRCIEASLSGRTTYDPWFERVVFLHPTSPSWKRDLRRFDETKEATLAVVDSPFRCGDEGEGERKQRKAQSLTDLLLGFRAGKPFERDGEVEIIGPFSVVVTLRREDLAYLRDQGVGRATTEEQAQWQAGELRIVPLLREQKDVLSIQFPPLDMWWILRRYLNLYNVPFDPPSLNDNDNPDLISPGLTQTVSGKSQGLPIYCEELARYLSSTKEEFRPETLQQFPPGLGDLYCHVLDKLFPAQVQKGAFDLLVLLASRRDAFSEGFYYLIFEDICPASDRMYFRKCWEDFRPHYLETAMTKDGNEKIIDGRKFLRLASVHLANTIQAIGLEQGEKLPVGVGHSYTRALLREKWQRRAEYVQKVVSQLAERLKVNLTGGGDVLLLADLARLGEEPARKAIALWKSETVKACVGEFTRREALAKEVYKVIVAYGFDAAKRRDVAASRTWFMEAFNILPDTKDIMYFASFLRVAALANEEKGTPEHHSVCSEIAALYKRILDTNPKDVRALTARARLWQILGDEDALTRAEGDLTDAVAIKEATDQDKLSALLSYSTFERKQGTALSSGDPELSKAKLANARTMLNAGLDLIDASSQIEEPDKAELRLKFIRGLEKLEVPEISSDWKGALARYEKEARAYPQSWYYPAKMGLCYQHLGDPDNCLRYYELSAEKTNPKWAKGFASLRNSLKDAVSSPGLGMDGSQKRKFELKMFEWSERAYNLNPHLWKNCLDYCEDLLREALIEKLKGEPAAAEKFAKARDVAVNGWHIYKKGLQLEAQRKKHKFLRWVAENRETLWEAANRFMWARGQALFGLEDIESGWRYVRIGASLENSFEGWAIMAQKAKDEVLREGTTGKTHAGERLRSIVKEGVKRLTLGGKRAGPEKAAWLLGKAKGIYREVGMKDEAALTHFYELVFNLPGSVLPAGDEITLSQRFGATGLEFLNAGYPEEALLCCLNALRLQKVPSASPCADGTSINEALADDVRAETDRRIANVKHLGEASHSLHLLSLERVLKRISRGIARRRDVDSLREPELKKCIFTDALGYCQLSRSFYRKIAAGPWTPDVAHGCAGFSQAQALRIAITGLIVLCDWSAALHACETIENLVSGSELSYVQCLERILQPDAVLPAPL